ncbi:MAG: hypothetical protein JW778_04700 [Candidatus Altiarchaeota archaeon]|nr:hypothetical protein [Candidatus Altiarchaeota archaeon]
MKPGLKLLYLLLAFTLASIAAAIPIDPPPGEGSLPQGSSEALSPQISSPSFSFASLAVVVSILYALLSMQPRFISDNRTFRVSEDGGSLWLKSGEEWIESSFSDQGSYLQYLQNIVSSSAEKVPVRNSEGKWFLYSRDSLKRYLSMLDSARSRISELEKEVDLARRRYFAAVREAKRRKTWWRAEAAGRYWDRVASELNSVKSSFSSLSSWSQDLSKLDFDVDYGFKLDNKTYSFSNGILSRIDAYQAYRRFRDKAESAKNAFYSSLNALFSGFQGTVSSLGWFGVDLVKKRAEELYQEYRGLVGSASQEFSADYQGGSSWKDKGRLRSELAGEVRDDMKEFYERCLVKIDELAFDKLVSAEEKARLKAEEARKKQLEEWRNQAFWDRNYDKILDKLKRDYEVSLSKAGKLGGAALDAYLASVNESFHDAVSAVNFLESRNRSGSEFDGFYLGYRDSVRDIQRLSEDAKGLNLVARVMSSLSAAVGEGNLEVGGLIDFLNGSVCELESSLDRDTYKWFRESLFDPWAEDFNKDFEVAREKASAELEQQMKALEEERRSFLEYQAAVGSAETQALINALHAKYSPSLDYQAIYMGESSIMMEEWNRLLQEAVQVSVVSTTTTTTTTTSTTSQSSERRENGIIDVTVGSWIGIGEGIYDTAMGLGHLVHGTLETGWNLSTKPGETVDDLATKFGYMFTHPVETGGAIIDAILEPILYDFDNGRPGEAGGRIGFEIAATILGGSWLKGLGKTDDVGRAVSVVGKVDEVGRVGGLTGRLGSLADNVGSVLDDILCRLKKRLGLGDEAGLLSKDELIKIGFKEEQISTIERLGLNRQGLKKIIDVGGEEQLKFALREYDDFVLKDMYEYASKAKEFDETQAIHVCLKETYLKHADNLGSEGHMFITDKSVFEGLDLTKVDDVRKLEGRLGMERGYLGDGSNVVVVQITDAKNLNPQIPSLVKGNELHVPEAGYTVGGAPERVISSLDVTIYPIFPLN